MSAGPRPPRAGGVGLRRARRGGRDARARGEEAEPARSAARLSSTSAGRASASAASRPRAARWPTSRRSGCRSSPARRRSAGRSSTSRGSTTRARARRSRPGRTATRSTRRAPAACRGVVPLHGGAGRARGAGVGARRGHEGGGRADPRGRRARRGRLGDRARRHRPASRTSSSSTSRRPRSTRASTTRAATRTSGPTRRTCSRQELARLAGTLVRGEPAPDAAAFDPTNGVRPNGPAYGSGAASGTLLAQPAEARTAPRARGDRVAGRAAGPRPPGRSRVRDRPAPRGGRWVRFDDDLGLAMLWQVDDERAAPAKWEIPRWRAGRHVPVS